MAASDPQSSAPALPDASASPAAACACLSAAALHVRLAEEINRAARQTGALGCLLVDVEDLAEIERAHGAELAEQALAYVGLALRREFRSFDRVGRSAASEFAVILPGADAARGELVARRTLARLHAIKLETGGGRRALRVAIGVAAWREGLTGEQLIEQARNALRGAEQLPSIAAPRRAAMPSAAGPGAGARTHV